MEKVLVLLSTYNGGKYLEEQLNSIAAQRDADPALLIRDDGSSDGTRRILERFRARNAAVRVTEGENLGACASFLRLLAQAPLEYDYYAFSDQDDVWNEGKLRAAVQTLEREDMNKPALYFCGQTVTDENLVPVYTHRAHPERSVRANCIFNQMSGCTAVWNRALMEKLKKYQPRLSFGHDVWVYRVCAALGGVIRADQQPYILYRQHKNNVVGLRGGLLSRLKRARDYLFRYDPAPYASEILRGYGTELDPKWKAFLQDVVRADQSAESRRRLRRDPEIDFKDGTLRALFLAKLTLRRMGGGKAGRA